MKILIADDEKIVRDGIRVLLEQSPYLFDEILVASTGTDALRLALEHHPNIVLTDIKMPSIDGLELAQRLRRHDSCIQVILITGYADFEYAQKAIQIGICGYLLKPVSEKDFYQLLSLAVRKSMTETISPSATTFAEALNRIILKNMKKENVLQTYPEYFPANLEYQLAVIKINACDQSNIFAQSVNTVFEAIAGRENVKNTFCIQNQSNPLECFLLHKAKKSDRAFVQLAIKIRSIIEERLNVPCYVSFSNVTNQMSGKLYSLCCIAYDKHLINPAETVFFYEDENSQTLLEHVEKRINHLDSCIMAKDILALQKNITDIFSEINTENFHNVRLLFFVTANTIINALSKLHVYLSEDDLNNIFSCAVLNTAKGIDELSEFFFCLAKNYMNQAGLLNTSCKDIVHEIKAYINSKYAQNLTEKELSTIFSITPAYLSQLFKKECGTSFVNYLTDVRIEKACELLRNTNIKVAELATIVGYTDKQYFHKVFKKKIGVTPLTYRLEHVTDH